MVPGIEGNKRRHGHGAAARSPVLSARGVMCAFCTTKCRTGIILVVFHPLVDLLGGWFMCPVVRTLTDPFTHF